uniref:(California timema) hypothetical protein n=1 Tax=Timema californicum TaxID=61474 RepID=A0A7R9JGM4_TIMCA|nr:unnamed protein product [Timema californicum]
MKCFFICFMEKSNITRNNTIDVEGLTNHKIDSDESDETVNDDVLMPLLKECKNKEGNQTIHKCVQGYQTFKCIMNAFDMSSSDGSGAFNGSDATTSSLR